METELCFGSVGDIIAICQLLVQLSKSINDATGSAQEYRELRNEMDEFVRLLMKIIAVYEQLDEKSPSMQSLDKEIRRIVERCNEFIEGNLAYLMPKYQKALGSDASGSKARKMFKSVQFLFSDKGRPEDVRKQLETYSSRINLLMSAAIGESARLAHGIMLSRIKAVEGLIQSQHDYLTDLNSLHSAALRDQSSQLGRLENNLVAQEQHLSGMKLGLGSALKSLQEIKQTLADISNMLHLQIASPMGFRVVNPTLGKPVVLENSLGELWEIPDWIEDWEGFEMFLALRFRNKRGHDMVMRKQFVLEESCSGTDIERQAPWSVAVRPGMKINMSMVFKKDSITLENFPRFKIRITMLKLVSVEWWQAERHTSPPLHSTIEADHYLLPQSQPRVQDDLERSRAQFRFLDHSDNSRVSGVTGQLNTKFAWNPAKVPADAMSHFQRVRLVISPGEAIRSSAVSSLKRTFKTSPAFKGKLENATGVQ